MTGSSPLTTPISTPRLRLSPATSGDLDAMGAWLETALAPEWQTEHLRDAVAAGDGVLISASDGTPIGIAVAFAGVSSPGCAVIPFLAVNPERRFRGLGGEAGIAIERVLRGAGFEAVYAPVPDGRGLAVYFWLRLGFRPLTQGESPGPVVGLSREPLPGIWMARDRLSPA